MHNNELNNISECNLLHDISNPPKRAKKLNNHYSTILHGCMNTIKVRKKFKNFCILLDSACSYTIIIGRLIEKYILKTSVKQWNTQARNITTNLKVKVYLT